MNRIKKIRIIEDENERKRLLKFYNRRNIIVCLGFLIICLLSPLTKQHLPPILIILINNPKKGLVYASIVITIDILLYFWLRIDTKKSLQLRKNRR